MTLESMEPDDALRLVQSNPANEGAVFTLGPVHLDSFLMWFPIASRNRKPLET